MSSSPATSEPIFCQRRSRRQRLATGDRRANMPEIRLTNRPKRLNKLDRRCRRIRIEPLPTTFLSGTNGIYVPLKHKRVALSSFLRDRAEIVRAASGIRRLGECSRGYYE